MEPRHLGPYDSNMSDNSLAHRSNGHAKDLEKAKAELKELLKKHKEIDLRSILQRWFPNGIPEVSGSYKHLLFLVQQSLDTTARETVINGDDVLNVQIALNTCDLSTEEGLNRFLEQV